jgi:CspA family cold shock protein
LTGTASGIVTEFDEARGTGTITADDAARYAFHCTQIADGSRSITPGTPVTFEIRPGHRGRWEARLISPRLPS